jgi:type IV pilus assembly protein PilQ
VILTIDASGGVAQAVDARGLPVVAATAPAPTGKQLLRDIDFRRVTTAKAAS